MADKTERPVALITGAASGIGAALARDVAGEYRAVALHARGAEARRVALLEQVAADIRADGAETLVLTGDLAEPGRARGLVEETVRAFGGLDHVVANAGFADRRNTAEISRADLDRAFDTMAGGFLELAQAAAPHVAAARAGRIVYVSSFVAHRFVTGGNFPATAAAKAAGEALVRAIALELARTGATVNAVAPGYTRKDQGHSALAADAWQAAAEATPVGRIAEPADVAALIAFLLSERARHITGQVIAVDGGLSLG